MDLFLTLHNWVGQNKVKNDIDQVLSSFKFNDITKLTNLALSVTKNDIPNEIN